MILFILVGGYVPSVPAVQNMAVGRLSGSAMSLRTVVTSKPLVSNTISLKSGRPPRLSSSMKTLRILR